MVSTLFVCCQLKSPLTFKMKVRNCWLCSLVHSFIFGPVESRRLVRWRCSFLWPIDRRLNWARAHIWESSHRRSATVEISLLSGRNYDSYCLVHLGLAVVDKSQLVWLSPKSSTNTSTQPTGHLLTTSFIKHFR